MGMQNKDLKECVDYIFKACPNPNNGLPEEVFLMLSALIPIANVDLFIFNENKQILLLWRDDIYFGQGWSIPGGCMRFNETLEQRVHKTALRELGQSVSIIEGPVTAKDVIRGANYNLQYPNQRGHNITIPFICKFDDCFTEKSNMKWFSEIPDNILNVHRVYNDLFKKYGLINK